MTIPLNWLDKFEGTIRAIDLPKNVTWHTGMVTFRFSWVTGHLWWRRQVTKELPFYFDRHNAFWPGEVFYPSIP